MINMEFQIEGCEYCGTFQRIFTQELYELGIEDNICDNCLKERLDNEQNEC